MKKDTQHRPGVSKSGQAALIASGQPQIVASRVSEAGSSSTAAAPTLSPPPSITMSARYIDSRLKQFCWR